MRLTVALLVGMVAQSASAQVRSFPYDALVDSGSVLVRSGPGQKYYATNRLNRGDRVTVHRHDPGGWYMIAPPTGSFSWIRSDAINRLDDSRGVVTDNNVVVRVGSALDDSRDVFQSRLSKGTAVRILGEKTFRTETGSVRMLKIAPPRGEWRWIPGHSVTPVDRVVRKQMDRDPYAVPSNARLQTESSSRNSSASSSGSKDSRDAAEQREQGPVLQTADDRAIRRSGPPAEEVSRVRRRLRELDRRFQEIIDRDTAEWDFRELRREYRSLQHDAAYPGLAGQVDLRLRSLQRYEQIKADYDSFIELTSATQQRDAELQNLQQQKLQAATRPPTPPQRAPGGIGNPRTSAPPPTGQQRRVAPRAPTPPVRQVLPRRHVVPRRRPRPAPQPQPTRRPLPQRTPVLPQLPPAGQAVPPQTGPRLMRRPAPRQNGGQAQSIHRAVPQTPQPQMIAAGVVQRAVAYSPGTPRHVLLEPNGRILAYLQAAEGVNLEAYLGRSMGLYGRRASMRGLQTEVIIVQGLRPVRLRR